MNKNDGKALAIPLFSILFVTLLPASSRQLTPAPAWSAVPVGSAWCQGAWHSACVSQSVLITTRRCAARTPVHTTTTATCTSTRVLR